MLTAKGERAPTLLKGHQDLEARNVFKSSTRFLIFTLFQMNTSAPSHLSFCLLNTLTVLKNNSTLPDGH